MGQLGALSTLKHTADYSRSKPDRSEFSHLTEGATGPDLTLIRVGGDGGDTRRLRPLRPKKV